MVSALQSHGTNCCKIRVLKSSLAPAVRPPNPRLAGTASASGACAFLQHCYVLVAVLPPGKTGLADLVPGMTESEPIQPARCLTESGWGKPASAHASERPPHSGLVPLCPSSLITACCQRTVPGLARAATGWWYPAPQSAGSSARRRIETEPSAKAVGCASLSRPPGYRTRSSSDTPIFRERCKSRVENCSLCATVADWVN